MLGAVVGGPVMGWLSDRFGITVPVAIGATMLRRRRRTPAIFW